MRRRRPARLAPSVISLALRLIPAFASSSSASRTAASTSAPAVWASSRIAFQGAVGALPREGGADAALGLGPQLPAPLAQQQARPLEVAGGEPGSGGDLLTARVDAGRGELCLQHSRGKRGEFDRLAAGGDGLEQALAVGAEQDQVDEPGRLLERLQQRVLTLVAHRLGGLDDEDALAAFEGPVGGGADHPLAHLLDHVLGAGRGEPDEVGMGRGVEQRPPPRVLGVGGRSGEDLRREGPRRGALAGPPRPAEEVGMRGLAGQRRLEADPRPPLMRSRLLQRRLAGLLRRGRQNGNSARGFGCGLRP